MLTENDIPCTSLPPMSPSHPAHIQTLHHRSGSCVVSVNLQQQFPMDDAAGIHKEGKVQVMTVSYLPRLTHCHLLSSNPSVSHTSSKVQMPSSLGSAPDHSPSLPPHQAGSMINTDYSIWPCYGTVFSTGDNSVFKAPGCPHWQTQMSEKRIWTFSLCIPNSNI